MTRLKTQDIAHITASLEKYNEELVKKTGRTLSQIAAHAVGAEELGIPRDKATVAVIPLTSGLGVIDGFSHSVAAIVSFLGFKSFVTDAPDAGGVAEAVAKGAGVLMMADDYRFVAVNIKNGRIADNGDATGKGYVAALDCLAGGVKDKEVLVIGAGPVGKGALEALIRFGAKPLVNDLDQVRVTEVIRNLKNKFGTVVEVEDQLEPALLKHRIIIDACPASGFLKLRHITEETLVAAPGIPLGIDEQALPALGTRLIHDPLEIGVATMISEVMLAE